MRFIAYPSGTQVYKWGGDLVATLQGPQRWGAIRMSPGGVTLNTPFGRSFYIEWRSRASR